MSVLFSPLLLLLLLLLVLMLKFFWRRRRSWYWQRLRGFSQKQSVAGDGIYERGWVSTKSTEKSFLYSLEGSPILGFKVSLSVFLFFSFTQPFLLFFLLRVQLSRQLLQVLGRDDAVIGDERLDDEEAFIFIVSSLLLLLPVFVIDKLSNGV